MLRNDVHSRISARIDGINPCLPAFEFKSQATSVNPAA